MDNSPHVRWRDAVGGRRGLTLLGEEGGWGWMRVIVREREEKEKKGNGETAWGVTLVVLLLGWKGTRSNNNRLRMCESGEDGDIFAMDGGVAEV